MAYKRGGCTWNSSATMTGPAQEVISQLKCMKCQKFKEKQMKENHSFQFKVGLSHRPVHQSRIFGVKLAKLTSSNESHTKYTQNNNFDVDIEIKMFLLYLFLLKVLQTRQS